MSDSEHHPESSIDMLHFVESELADHMTKSLGIHGRSLLHQDHRQPTVDLDLRPE